MEYNFNGIFLINLIKDRIKEKKTIFEKPNLDTRDKFYRNALYWAIKYQKEKDVELLLKYGISKKVAPNLDALSLAKQIGNQKIISLLEEKRELALA
jgi:ankyrin repeat protein